MPENRMQIVAPKQLSGYHCQRNVASIHDKWIP